MKRLYVLLAFFALFLITLYLVLSLGGEREVKIKDNNIKGKVRDTLESTPDPADNPVMHDFVYSTIGYKSDMVGKDFGESYLLMVNDEFIDSESGIVHISRLTTSDFYPPVSTGHFSYEVKDHEWGVISNLLKSWPEDLKFDALTHTMYVLKNSYSNNKDPYEVGINGKWNGINLSEMNFPDGWFLENIDSGWPTEWINKSPHKELIEERYNVNLDSEFFKDFKMGEIIVVDSKDGAGARSIRVVGDDKLETIEPPVWQMGLKQMNLQLEEEGFNKIDKR